MQSIHISRYPLLDMSRDSSDGIATGYDLDDQMIEVRFPAGGWEFFSSTESGAHPVSHQMGTVGSFRGVKAAGM
jgi:hypothetical protein